MASRHNRSGASFADAFMKAHEEAGDDDEDEDFSCDRALVDCRRMSRREQCMVLSATAIVILLIIQFWEGLAWSHFTGPTFEGLVARYLDDRCGDPASHVTTALDEFLARKFNETCVPLGIGHRESTLRAPDACLSREEMSANLIKLVLITSAVFTQANVTHFLDSGTLLGAVRHRSVIRYDQDVDFGIDEAGYETLRTTSVIFPREYQLHVFNSSVHVAGSRYLELPVRVIHLPTTLYADVFVYVDSSDRSRREIETGPLASGAFVNCIKCSTAPGSKDKRFRVPYDWIYPVRGCRFAGYELQCPHKPHEYLQFMFGDDYMQPIVYPS